MAKINPIQLQKHLKGIRYPAQKAALIHCAKEHGANETILAVLEKLESQTYETPAAVSQAISQIDALH
jgi:Protein of unknown function (DUF2795)